MGSVAVAVVYSLVRINFALECGLGSVARILGAERQDSAGYSLDENLEMLELEDGKEE